MEWKNGEAGPTCLCGKATIVSISHQGINLVCLYHTHEAGAFFPLPKRRPSRWPNLSEAEMERLVDEGFAEQEVAENTEVMLDMGKVLN